MSTEEERSGQRIQKLIANTGLASRRQAEAWIVAHRVTVNGKTAQLGERAGAQDVIEVDGRALPAVTSGPLEVAAYHKPCGQITTRSDTRGRPTVFSALPPPAQGRWITVGRLDIQTSGLLLLTTCGELAHQLMHPSNQLQRRYQVRVCGVARREQLTRLTRGVTLEDGKAKFDYVRTGRGSGVNRWYEVALREGRNRAVRRMWQAVGLEVSRLIRIGYGPIDLSREQAAGEVRWLSRKEIHILQQACTASQRRPRSE